MTDLSELVGSHITIRNPHNDAAWEGRAVAYAEDPTLLIELADGFRLMLPAAWATTKGDDT